MLLLRDVYSIMDRWPTRTPNLAKVKGLPAMFLSILCMSVMVHVCRSVSVFVAVSFSVCLYQLSDRVTDIKRQKGGGGGQA